MNYYMHTINGFPGSFDGDQISYWWNDGHLVNSLSAINHQRKKSLSFRKKHFPKAPIPSYDHILIKVPK